MSVLYIAVPVALVIGLIAVIAFVIQVRNGQYDDLETPAQRMLFDEVEKSSEAEKEICLRRANQSDSWMQ